MASPAAQVAQILAAQYGPVDLAFHQAQASSNRQRALLSAAQAALVKQLQSGVGQAGRVYDQAVAQQQALAHAGAAGLAGASPDAGIQRDLASIGAPANQRANLAAANARDFGGQGGVLYNIQGSVPGSSLIANKAAVQAFQAGLPTVAAAAGQQTLRALLANELKQAQQYQLDRAKIASQAPGLLQSLEAAQASMAYRQQRAQVSDYFRSQSLALARQRAARQAAGGGKGSKSPSNQKLFFTTRGKAFKQAQALYDQSQATTGSKRKLDTNGAYNVLWNTYAPTLLNAGYKRRAVNRMIQKALHTAGYRPVADAASSVGSYINALAGNSGTTSKVPIGAGG